MTDTAVLDKPKTEVTPGKAELATLHAALMGVTLTRYRNDEAFRTWVKDAREEIAKRIAS